MIKLKTLHEKANEAEEVLREIEPSLIINDFRVQEDCGCYSEYTTDPPSLYVSASAIIKDETSPDAISLRDKLSERLKRWAKEVFHFTGCTCCCPNDNCEEDHDHSDAASIWIYLTRRKE